MAHNAVKIETSDLIKGLINTAEIDNANRLSELLAQNA